MASFTPADGFKPIHCKLTEATNGYFYGTTIFGGVYGKGSIFRLSRGGELKTVFSFQGSNGNQPLGGLVQASDGRLYGTTGVGGNNDEGTVFRFSNNGGLTTLIHFSGANGWLPATALMQASDGNLYGSTIAGGGYDEGTIFRLTTNGLFKVLVHFNGANGRRCRGRAASADEQGLMQFQYAGATNAAARFYRLAPK